MLSNLSLSLAAALAFSAAGGAARAAASPTKSVEAGARPSSTNDEINALETGNPHSVDYRNRVIPSHSPTNDEINALETGNPDSVDYRNRSIPRQSTNDEINASETGNPHSVDSNKGQQRAPTDSSSPAVE